MKLLQDCLKHLSFDRLSPVFIDAVRIELRSLIRFSSQNVSLATCNQEMGTRADFWEPNGNNNGFQQRLPGFQERPGPCKYSVYLRTEKWHGRGRRFEPDQVHQSL
jgi:hypothetical protein